MVQQGACSHQVESQKGAPCIQQAACSQSSQGPAECTIGCSLALPHLPVLPAAFAGYAVYDVQGARSGLLPVSYLSDQDYPFSQCIGLFSYYNAAGNAPAVNTSLTTLGYNVRAGPATSALPACMCADAAKPSRLHALWHAHMIVAALPHMPQCNVFINRVSDQWKQRVSIIVYAMVIVATVGWVLFMVFGAIGIVMLPMDWIREFIGRPKATITRSQYIDRARDLARRAKVGGCVAV